MHARPRSAPSTPWRAAALCLALTACADAVTGPPAGGTAASTSQTAVREDPEVPTVHVVYLVPADRPVDRAYVRALTASATNLQAWYQEQMGGSETFRLTKPVVEVIRTEHDASWYAAEPTEGDPVLQFWDNVLADAFALTGGGFYQDDLWVYFVDAAQACGQITGATSGVAVMPRNELIGLAGETTTHPCTGERLTLGSCFWVGVLGHEVGHALGLPHPAACDPMTADCPYFTLMWRGFELYPETSLLPSDVAALDASPFVMPTRLHGRVPDCADIGTRGPTAVVAAARPFAGASGEQVRSCAFDRLPVVARRR